MDSTTRLSSKVITATRDMTATSGDVAYTGVGFTPTAIVAIGNINSAMSMSIGASDSAKNKSALFYYGNNTTYNDPFMVEISTAAGAFQGGIIKTYDADGFTITWTKGGSPTGTANLIFLCFR